jgi:hypothetical protein
MKFYQPLPQLVRETGQSLPDAYCLHVVTFSPNTQFQADGYTTDDEDLQSEGVYKVNIFLKQNTTLPSYDYLTPIAHTIELGELTFPGGEGSVRVHVFYRVLEPQEELKNGGKSSVGTTDADVKLR